MFPPLTGDDTTRITKFWDSQLASLRQVDRSVGGVRAGAPGLGRAAEHRVRVHVGQRPAAGRAPDGGVKVWPYEESIRVPLVVAGYGVAHPGRQDDHLVLNIDLAPTIAELAGVKPGLNEDGREPGPAAAGRGRAVARLVRRRVPRPRRALRRMGGALRGHSHPPLPVRALREAQDEGRRASWSTTPTAPRSCTTPGDRPSPSFCPAISLEVSEDQPRSSARLAAPARASPFVAAVDRKPGCLGLESQPW